MQAMQAQASDQQATLYTYCKLQLRMPPSGPKVHPKRCSQVVVADDDISVCGTWFVAVDEEVQQGAVAVANAKLRDSRWNQV